MDYVCSDGCIPDSNPLLLQLSFHQPGKQLPDSDTRERGIPAGIIKSGVTCPCLLPLQRVQTRRNTVELHSSTNSRNPPATSQCLAWGGSTTLQGCRPGNQRLEVTPRIPVGEDILLHTILPSSNKPQNTFSPLKLGNKETDNHQTLHGPDWDLLWTRLGQWSEVAPSPIPTH